MENSRHERAIIVAASYIIGFTSAFIAFGIQVDAPSKADVVATTNGPAVFTVSPDIRNTSLEVKDVGLVLMTDKGERLLTSRKSSPLVASIVTAAPQPGLAVRLTEAELSRDGNYVYFCEQLTENAVDCDAYVYSVQDEMLYPVRLNNDIYKPYNATHSSSWSANGLLTIGNHASIAATTPWLLK